MAQFPMGGFLNGQRQNMQGGRHFQQPFNYGMGNMHPSIPMQGPNPMFGPKFGGQNFHAQQNVPRGTFPSNFTPNFRNQSQANSFQSGMPQMRPPHPPANMPNAMPRVQAPVPMPQQSTAPTQQMPPMHLLNPTNDPHVKFEPIPNGFVPPSNAAAPGPAHPTQAPSSPAADINPNSIANRLSDYAQGESNSLIYYENLSRSSQISEERKGFVQELIDNKKQHVHNMAQLYRELSKQEWVAHDMKIAGATNFKSAISYALLQESRLLREASQIYLNMNNEAHQRIMNSVLYNKIADMAHLMAL